MPIYEYSCPDCSHDFEKIVKVGAPAPPCPECEGTDVAKKVSLSAFHLKGGGWYAEAYAGKDNKKPGAASAEPTPSPAAAVPAAAAATPAPKADAPKAKPASTSTPKSAT